MDLMPARRMLRPLTALKSALFEMLKGKVIVVARWWHVLTEGNNCFVIDSCVRSILLVKIKKAEKKWFTTSL